MSLSFKKSRNVRAAIKENRVMKKIAKEKNVWFEVELRILIFAMMTTPVYTKLPSSQNDPP